MSFYQNITAKVFIEKRKNLVENLIAKLTEVQKSYYNPIIKLNGQECEPKDFRALEEHNTFEFSCTFERSGGRNFIEEFFREIDESEDQDYAIELYDSDYGAIVQTFGKIESKKMALTGNDIHWTSGDYLTVGITLPADKWCEFLACDADEIEDELCDQDGEVLLILFGEELSGALFGEEMDFGEFDEETGAATFNTGCCWGNITSNELMNYGSIFKKAIERMENLDGIIEIGLSEEFSCGEEIENILIAVEDYYYCTIKTGPNFYGEIEYFTFA